MNLKQQAEILFAAIAGKDLLLQKRNGKVRIRFTPGFDTRFNFQDNIYEVANVEPKQLSIETQACILGAASIGEQIEATLCPASSESIWRPITFPYAFDFTKLAYRVAEEKPKTRGLHQYIVRMSSGNYKTTYLLHIPGRGL